MHNETEWNTQVTKIHHTRYVRNTRAITVAWFVFCACYTILNIVAFIQPFWFGDTNASPGVGYFGVYEWCERVQGSDYRCEGDFLDFNTIKNDYFRATAFLVGLPVLLFMLSIICMLLFLFLKARIVLRMCGTLQFLAGLCMAVACIIYPASWDDEAVRRICGQEATAYQIADCQIRWAYILGIVLIFDAFILSILAFVLAARQARDLPAEEKIKKDRGNINDAFSGNIVRDNDSNSNIHRSLRHRHSYNDLQPAPQRIKPFYHEVMHKVPDEEIDTPRDNPVVFPVESFGNSSESNRSDPDSPQSNEQSIPGSSQSDSDRLQPVIATEIADIHF